MTKDGGARRDGPLLPSDRGRELPGRTRARRTAEPGKEERTMISFGPTEEQELVREAMRELRGRRAAAGRARRPTRRAKLPDDVLAAGLGARPRRDAAPEAYGGGGEARSPITNALVARGARLRRRRARASPSTHAGRLRLRGRSTRAPRSRRRRCLPLFCGDALPRGVARLRRAGRRPSTPLRARARPPSRRATRFVLSGAKSFVPLADRASHFLVIARNAQARRRLGALDAFVVPRDAAGLTIVERREEPRPARAADRPRSRSSASRWPPPARLGGAARLRRAAPARRSRARRSPRCWSASRAR